MDRSSRILHHDECRLLLGQTVDQLLHLDGEYAKLRTAATQLYFLLSEITGVGDSSEQAEDKRETILACGKAISPNDAARSILDYYRTAQFLRGSYAAIQEAQRRFSHRPIEILYAGCGPFAPFAIALATQFSPDEIQFTLLDIHARSLTAVRQIVQFLGLSTFIRGYVEGDATSYRHPGNSKLHIVITETMQKALASEPQVAITMNLSRQLCPTGIFIPERVTIDVCLSNLSKEMLLAPAEEDVFDRVGKIESDKSRVNVGRIFELKGPSSCDQCPPLAVETATGFAPVTLEIPRDLDDRLCLMLLTRITVFDGFVLGDYDSGLTYPTILHDLGSAVAGSRIEFRYALGDQPGFRYRLLPTGRAVA